MVFGTKKTMIVEGEQEMLLYKEADRNLAADTGGKSTTITVETEGGEPALAASPSAAGPSGKAAPDTVDGDTSSRGYREKLEYFAYCVRNGNNKEIYHAPVGISEENVLLPRCRGQVALTDAVVGLTSNLK